MFRPTKNTVYHIKRMIVKGCRILFLVECRKILWAGRGLWSRSRSVTPISESGSQRERVTASHIDRLRGSVSKAYSASKSG